MMVEKLKYWLDGLFDEIEGQFADNNANLGIGSRYRLTYYNDDDFEHTKPLHITIKGDNTYELSKSLLEQLEKHKDEDFFVGHKDGAVATLKLAIKECNNDEYYLRKNYHAHLIPFTRYAVWTKGDNYYHSFMRLKDAQSVKQALDFNTPKDIRGIATRISTITIPMIAFEYGYTPTPKQKAQVDLYNNKMRMELKDTIDFYKGKITKDDFIKNRRERNKEYEVKKKELSSLPDKPVFKPKKEKDELVR